MNSKSRKFLLYTLCAIMALTQVAFVGAGRNDTSEESVINNTNETIDEELTLITETKETESNVVASVTTVTTESNAEVIVVDTSEFDMSGVELLLGAETDKEPTKYDNMIVSYADPYLCVRSIADKDGKLMGKMYPGSYAEILERGEEWTKIKSGKVEGYIRNIYVCFDDEATALAGQINKKLTTALTLEEDAKRSQTPTGGGIVNASTYEACLLAAIIDWEANNEPYEGKVAVGTVVLNRVKSGRFPNSIQEVLLAPGQFGGVLSGGGFSSRFQDRINKYTGGNGKAECIKAANEALAGANPLNGTYYYFNTVYGAGVTQIQQIGNHYFYNY